MFGKNNFNISRLSFKAISGIFMMLIGALLVVAFTPLWMWLVLAGVFLIVFGYLIVKRWG